MKSIAIVSSLLLSTSSYVQATSLSELALRPPLLRRAAEELDSNDKIDYLSFQKYNCEGMFLDWSGPSAITNTLESKVVEYDYDVYMEKGSDRTSVLASIQNRLLRYVGNDLFLVCSSRRLSEGFAMEEITTAPGDQPSLPQLDARLMPSTEATMNAWQWLVQCRCSTLHRGTKHLMKLLSTMP
eukprot:g14085.t1 g14085   contig9:1128413-1128964(-)